MSAARVGVQAVRGASLGVALALLLCAGRVHAGPVLESFGAPIGQGGLTARVAAPSASATYFNPALLPDATEGLELGALCVHERIDITLMPRPPGHDVPDGVGSYVAANQSDLPLRPLPSASLEHGDPSHGTRARPRGAQNGSHGTRSYLAIGLVKRLWAERLALGVTALVPVSGLVNVSAHFSDEREQYFSNSLRAELYGERLGVASIAAGLGLRVLPRLSVGASASLSLANSATARSYVASAAALDEAQINIGVRAKPSFAPQLGLVYTPTPRLSVSLTAHGKESVRVRSSFGNLLASGDEAGARRTFVFGYVPWRASAGLRLGLFGGPRARAEGALAAVAELANFRAYRDSHGERPDRYYRFRDVVSPALGFKLRVRRVYAFVDGAVAPTPVPPQTGRTNYVDMTRYALALGAELRFPLGGLDYKLGLLGQLGILPRRSQRKRNDMPTGSAAGSLVVDEVPDDARDASQGLSPAAGAAGLQTNNPGFPGFSSRGLLGTVGLYGGVGF